MSASVSISVDDNEGGRAAHEAHVPETGRATRSGGWLVFALDQIMGQ